MKLIIDDAVYQQIMYYVRLSTIECSGLGKVVVEGENLRVVSACLLKQENTSGTTDIEPQAVTKAMFELREAPGLLNFWWHSHVNMDAFWSGTDTATIKEIGAPGFCIATVFNKKSESRTAFFKGPHDGMPGFFIDDIEMEVDRRLDLVQCAQWKSDFEAKCSAKTYSYPRIGATWVPGDVELDQVNYRGYYGRSSQAYDHWPKESRAQDVFEFKKDKSPPLWDYRTVQKQGEITDVNQLDLSIRLDTIDKLNALVDSMMQENQEHEVRKWLGKICHIVHQIDRHLITPLGVSLELKKEYKEYYIEMANDHIKYLRKDNSDVNSTTTNIN